MSTPASPAPASQVEEGDSWQLLPTFDFISLPSFSPYMLTGILGDAVSLLIYPISAIISLVMWPFDSTSTEPDYGTPVERDAAEFIKQAFERDHWDTAEEQRMQEAAPPTPSAAEMQAREEHQEQLRQLQHEREQLELEQQRRRRQEQELERERDLIVAARMALERERQKLEDDRKSFERERADIEQRRRRDAAELEAELERLRRELDAERAALFAEMQRAAQPQPEPKKERGDQRGDEQWHHEPSPRPTPTYCEAGHEMDAYGQCVPVNRYAENYEEPRHYGIDEEEDLFW